MQGRITSYNVCYTKLLRIAIIDGKTGFIGGFNIGDDYLSRIAEWAPWRDTAIQVDGDCVAAMQIRFFLDWNYAAKGDELDFDHRYFPEHYSSSDSWLPIQIVSA